MHGCVWCQTCKIFNGASCSETCPVSNNQENLLLNKIILSFPVVCSFNNQGCTEKMPVKSIIEHEIICDYRMVLCFLCKNPAVLIQLGSHFKEDHSSFITKTDFFVPTKIKINLLISKSGCCVFLIEKPQKYFFFLYHFFDNPFCLETCPNCCKGNPEFRLCLTYLGKRDEASKFLYEFKIDQGLKSYYSRSEICNPHCSANEISDPSFLHKPKVNRLDVSDIFLTDDYKSGFDMFITIKPLDI